MLVSLGASLGASSSSERGGFAALAARSSDSLPPHGAAELRLLGTRLGLADTAAEACAACPCNAADTELGPAQQVRDGTPHANARAARVQEQTQHRLTTADRHEKT